MPSRAAAAVRLLEAGQYPAAREQSRLAEALIDQLRAAEPAEPEHIGQLASLHYTLAVICEQSGDMAGALASARKAVNLYIEANGADVTPLSALGDLMLPADNRRGPGSAEYAAYIADAKARLGRLLAKAGRGLYAREARQLCTAAVRTYRALLRTNPRLADDLRRVERQHAEAESYF